MLLKDHKYRHHPLGVIHDSNRGEINCTFAAKEGREHRPQESESCARPTELLPLSADRLAQLTLSGMIDI